MINDIELTNFKCHEHLAISFTPGVNVIRGPNGGGKTTLLKAILYALAGTPAAGLKDHLTHWGAGGGMEVTLTADLPRWGKCRVVRSLRAAQVRGPQGEVLASGHNPVNEFIAESLGVDPKTLQLFSLSKQKETAGLITLGATEIQRKVEQAAGVDLVDTVLKLMSGDRHALDGELAGIGEVGDLVTLEAELARLDQEVAQASTSVERGQSMVEQAEAGIAELQKRVIEAERLRLVRESLESGLKRLAAEIAGSRDTLATLEKQIEQTPERPTQPLQTRAEQTERAYRRAAEARETLRTSGAEIATLTEWLAEAQPTQEHNAKLLPRIEAAAAELARAREQEAALTAEKQALDRETRRIREALSRSVCPTCKRPFDAGEHAHAQEALEEAQQRLEDAAMRLRAGQKAVADAVGRVEALRAQRQPDNTQEIARAQARKEALERTRETLLAELPDLSDDSLNGLAEVARKATRQLQEAVSGNAQRRVWVEEQTRLVRVLARTQEERRKAEARLAALPPAVDLDLFKTELTGLIGHRDEARQVLAQAQVQHNALSATLAVQKNRLDEARRKAGRRAEVETRLALVKELESYLRASRPRLLQGLWGGVLALASEMIALATEGRLADLTRDEQGGFAVQKGEYLVPAYELSGAEESICGLCLRLAIAQVFYQGTGFVLLDEPAADCDDQNAAGMTALFLGLGQQVVLVTHKDIEQAAATNIVDLAV